MKWEVPPIWMGSTVFVIGGGPSVIGADLCLTWEQRERLFSSHVIGVNNAGFLDDRIDVLFFGDAKWFNWNEERLNNHNSIIVTNNPRYEEHRRIKYLVRRNGIDARFKHADVLPWAGSSGGSAILLAILFGAKRIVLVGYDMRRVNDQKNFHREHQEGNPSHDPYRRFISRLNGIKRTAQRYDIIIVNATPNSALPYFDIVNLTDEIKRLEP